MHGTISRHWLFPAIVLACAGLERLGFEHRIRAQLAPPQFLPAVAQGAIAIETRTDAVEITALCAALGDLETTHCVHAERAMNRALHGSCQVPIAGFATLNGTRLHLRALVGDAATGEIIRAEAHGEASDPEPLGREVAAQLERLGVRRLLG